MSDADAVVLAYVHDAEVAYSWHHSVVNLLGYDISAHQHVVRGGWLAVRYGTGGIVDARNQAVEQFLAGDADWLFWIDTDMGFAPDTVDQLLAAADRVERPVVGGLCFAQREYAPDGAGGFRCTAVPTLYRWEEREDGVAGFAPWLDYPADQVVPVDATGSACLLIHRSALEAAGAQPYSRMANPTTGQLISEDLAFCARLAAKGVPVHVHTGVRTTHLKHVWLAEGDYDPEATLRAITPGVRA